MEATSTLFGLWILANVSPTVWATVTVNGFYCGFSKELTANGNCHLLTAKSGTTYLTAGVTFLKPTDDVWLRLKFLRKVNAKLEIFGVTFNQNFCDLKNGDSFVFFKRIFVNGMKAIKNLNCPLLGNVTISRYRFLMPMAQGFLPPANYLLNYYMVATRQNLYVLDGNISFSVTAIV